MIRFTFVLLLVFIVSCKPSGEQKTKDPAESATGGQEVKSSIQNFEGPAQLLLQQLRDQGDYVNSRQFPSMIQAETVYAEREENNLIIDIRSSELFDKGRIKDAVNIPMDKLLSYFENDIIPFKFGKIILVCNGGQRSGYATELLRLMGYANVYSMHWGMSGWNPDFASYILENKISSDYQDKLETKDEVKPASVNQPVLKSTASSGEEILRERVSVLLAMTPSDIFISSKDLFTHPEDYYIVNFERKDKYDSGHIPGAIRYKSQGTLGIPSEMGSLPVDKTIVVYCGTGMTSAFVVAYLKLFGYDARSLSYGNNSFMYNKMIADQEKLSWHPFTSEVFQNFPYDSGN